MADTVDSPILFGMQEEDFSAGREVLPELWEGTLMLIMGEGSATGGPLDFICILRDVRTGRFHPCFVEEKPMPGPTLSVEDTKFVRAKSKMHHTGGFDTFEEAQAYVRDDFSKKLIVPDGNVALNHAINWDSQNIAFVIILPNWIAEKRTIEDVLAVDAICGEQKCVRTMDLPSLPSLVR